MQSAKRKMQKVGSALRIINITNLVCCMGRSLCPPASEHIIYGRARRLATTLFDGQF